MLLKKLDEAKYICIGVVWRIGHVIWRSGRSLADFGSVWQNVAEQIFVGAEVEIWRNALAVKIEGEIDKFVHRFQKSSLLCDQLLHVCLILQKQPQCLQIVIQNSFTGRILTSVVVCSQ